MGASKEKSKYPNLLFMILYWLWRTTWNEWSLLLSLFKEFPTKIVSFLIVSTIRIIWTKLDLFSKKILRGYTSSRIKANQERMSKSKHFIPKAMFLFAVVQKCHNHHCKFFMAKQLFRFLWKWYRHRVLLKIAMREHWKWSFRLSIVTSIVCIYLKKSFSNNSFKVSHNAQTSWGCTARRS